jgi:para-nitrobenzyl esterase
MTARQAASADRVRAHTAAGAVDGTRRGPVDVFLGIPYAAPPTGAHRWRSPQAVESWPGVRPATRFGPSALQPVDPQGFGPWTHEYVVQGEVSEDCLYLNVWAPVGAASKPRPVLVWIHGGAFTQGSGSVAVYDGHALACQGLVVVTLNYRLGALGFLAHPELANDQDPCSGNFGLQDQIAALQWVRQNIAHFGGDPNAVTIAGQSAGAVSVHMLVSSPAACGLFQRAIAQSGPPSLLGLHRREEAEADGLAFAVELGCTSVDALRALDARQLLVAPSATPRFRPFADGRLLPAWPPAACSPAVNDVPMLVGQNRDENSAFDPLYEMLDETNAARAYRQGCLDRWLAALWQWAGQRASSARSPIYAYLFDHVAPGPQADLYGCFHTSEVPYAFGTLDAAPERGFTDLDRRISATVSRYWINFVCRGTPNGTGAAEWPPLDPPAPLLMRLADACAPQPMFSPAQLAALREHLAQGGSVQVL